MRVFQTCRGNGFNLTGVMPLSPDGWVREDIPPGRRSGCFRSGNESVETDSFKCEILAESALAFYRTTAPGGVPPPACSAG